MKDIKINTPFKKIQYFVCWIMFILFGFIIVWFIALFLANYGKYTNLNKKKKKNTLNKSYQKFIFWYGSIMQYIIFIGLIFSLIT